MSDASLIVIGASARAACFSVRRASFSPYWIDQFGDHDLATQFPGQLIKKNGYPDTIPALLEAAPSAPFIYTGAMENHLQVLGKLEQIRPLLGNSAAVCRSVRDPRRLADCFQRNGIKHPRVLPATEHVPASAGTWLVKPLRSAGGKGIDHYRGGQAVASPNYLQEYIKGESRTAVFIAAGSAACLLGITAQLVGESFLHAAPFSYCGSIGPLPCDDDENSQWRSIGNNLAGEFGLKGLFCVDAICRDGDIYPVEINPRYSASVEVLELAMQCTLIDLHYKACQGQLPSTPLARDTIVAKAYLFAGQDLRSPANLDMIYNASVSLPLTADIPAANSLIQRGHPLMTVLINVGEGRDAKAELAEMSAQLYRQFQVI